MQFGSFNTAIALVANYIFSPTTLSNVTSVVLEKGFVDLALVILSTRPSLDSVVKTEILIYTYSHSCSLIVKHLINGKETQRLGCITDVIPTSPFSSDGNYDPIMMKQQNRLKILSLTIRTNACNLDIISKTKMAPNSGLINV